ncbi:MAG: DUF1501 domain-containing protein [Verrucomicrobia bacterium]|nr:MAG: DUF1501 domain-containing protein [Verrucomicrobiota bacterium]
MDPICEFRRLAGQAWTRRVFLGRAAQGLGAMALASLLGPRGMAAAVPKAKDRWTGTVDPPHFRPRAKRVIWLTMAGGPSHLETFDYKPKLAAMHGQPMPESVTAGQQIAQLQGQKLFCFGPQTTFARYGRCGAEITALFPAVGSVADELCIVRSMTSEAINHDPAHTFMNTGTQIVGRPSMGTWATYGLGSEAEDLPGFVVLVSQGVGRSPQPIAARQWSAGFLPGRFQGVPLRGKGEAVHYLQNPRGVTRGRQGDVIRAVGALDARHDAVVDDPEIAARIAQYEMAYRMQASVPDLMDTSGEPEGIRDLYGCTPGDGSFASNCLLARRLAERGVRFIQLYHRDWDHHSGLREELPVKARETDRACGALIRDLKQRGMLEDTLVVWAGEFGRTPMSQTNKGSPGRDHHNKGFSIWLAGGGVKGGIDYGATDDLGYNAVENRVSVHDLHATMLRLLGIDHARFTEKFQGLDWRLTGVEGARVLDGILA